MKKLIERILTFVMILSLNVATFAATVGTGDQEIAVKGKYQDKTTVPVVYSVDVSWGIMQFNCTKSGTKTWNPANHSYTDNTSVRWTANGNRVTVTNHSNAEVTASFTFKPLNKYNTVVGSFDIVSDKLDAGAVGNYNSADKVVTTLTLDGSLAKTVTNYTEIGTITVRIE